MHRSVPQQQNRQGIRNLEWCYYMYSMELEAREKGRVRPTLLLTLI